MERRNPSASGNFFLKEAGLGRHDGRILCMRSSAKACHHIIGTMPGVLAQQHAPTARRRTVHHPRIITESEKTKTAAIAIAAIVSSVRVLVAPDFSHPKQGSVVQHIQSYSPLGDLDRQCRCALLVVDRVALETVIAEALAGKLWRL